MNLALASRRLRLPPWRRRLSRRPRTLLYAPLLLSLALPAFASANAGGGAPVCHDESELAGAAAAILQAGSWRSAEAVSQAVRDAGSDVVLVRGFYAAGDDAGFDAFLSAYVRDADAPVVCGFAAGAEGRLLLVAARAGALEHAAPRAKTVRGTLSPAFRDPELVVSDASGTLKRWHVSRELLASGVPLPEGLEPPVRVQMLAHGPRGLRPVAERTLSAAKALASSKDSRVKAEPQPATKAASSKDGPVAAEPQPGANAPALPHGDPASDGAADDPAQLIRDVAQMRAAQARRTLRSNRLLDHLAQEQARFVCESGRVGHETEPGRDPERRLAQAGVEARRVGEVVARAESVAAAWSSLERSPAHRMSLLEPGFTDGGYGLAHDSNGHRCVVVLLAAWPRYVGR